MIDKKDYIDLDKELKRQLLECQKDGFQMCINVIKDIDEQATFDFKPLIKLLEDFKKKIYEDDEEKNR